jgi:CheY-like chemotaxis protein
MTPGQYILVVDDDDDFREALAEILTSAGYPAEQAENGEVALRRIGEEAPGVVLLDLKMPVLDGWGVVERMRKDPRTAHIPILILSAYGFEWESELLGAQGFIPKSVGMEEKIGRAHV